MLLTETLGKSLTASALASFRQSLLMSPAGQWLRSESVVIVSRLVASNSIEEIDTDKRGWITFDQFMAFANKRDQKLADDILTQWDRLKCCAHHPRRPSLSREKGLKSCYPARTDSPTCSLAQNITAPEDCSSDDRVPFQNAATSMSPERLEVGAARATMMSRSAARNTAIALRQDVAALKGRMAELEREVASHRKAASNHTLMHALPVEPPPVSRYSAEGVRASATASACRPKTLARYWASVRRPSTIGSTAPLAHRPVLVERLATLRSVGKREAIAYLHALDGHGARSLKSRSNSLRPMRMWPA